MAGQRKVDGSADKQRLIDSMPAASVLTSDPDWQKLTSDEQQQIMALYHQKVTLNSTRFKTASPERQQMMMARIKQSATGEAFNPPAPPSSITDTRPQSSGPVSNVLMNVANNLPTTQLLNPKQVPYKTRPAQGRVEKAAETVGNVVGGIGTFALGAGLTAPVATALGAGRIAAPMLAGAVGNLAASGPTSISEYQQGDISGPELARNLGVDALTGGVLAPISSLMPGSGIVSSVARNVGQTAAQTVGEVAKGQMPTMAGTAQNIGIGLAADMLLHGKGGRAKPSKKPTTEAPESGDAFFADEQPQTSPTPEHIDPTDALGGVRNTRVQPAPFDLNTVGESQSPHESNQVRLRAIANQLKDQSLTPEAKSSLIAEAQSLFDGQPVAESKAAEQPTKPQEPAVSADVHNGRTTPSPFTGVKKGSRKEALIKEAISSGDLAYNHQTGYWGMGPRETKLAKDLIDAKTAKTLAEKHAEASSNYEASLKTYAEHGQEMPAEAKTKWQSKLDSIEQQAGNAHPNAAEGYWSEEAVNQRIRQSASRANAGFPVDQMADYVARTSHQIKRGLSNFSEWARTMLGEHGDSVRPFLKSIWENAHAALGSGNPDGFLSAFMPAKTKTYSVDEGLFRRNAQPVGVSADGHPIFEAKGKQWELYDSNEGRVVVREVSPEGDGLMKKAEYGFNNLFRPGGNASAETYSAIKEGANTGRLGESVAELFDRKAQKLTPEQQKQAHQDFDDPTGEYHTLSDDQAVKEIVAMANRMDKEVQGELLSRKLIENELETHAPHHYEKFQSPVFATQSESFGPLSKNGITGFSRKYATMFEAQSANPDLVPIWNIRATGNAFRNAKRAIAAHDVLETLRGMTDAEGNPLIAPADDAPLTYKMLNDPHFSGQRVHPNVYAAVKAFIDDGNGLERSRVYRFLMGVKGIKLAVDMVNPAIHGMNVYGKFVFSGLGLKGIKNGFSLLRDESMIRRASKAGVNLGGGHLAPIADLIDGNTATEVGFLERVDPTPNKSIAKAYKWSHDGLWDSVHAMQLASWLKLSDEYHAKGASRAEAEKAAAYVVNNWAGMIPREDMSAFTRMAANLTLYSRGWTLGNWKSAEAAVRGAKSMPPDIRNGIAGKMAADTMRSALVKDIIANKMMLAALNGMMSYAILGKWQFPWENEHGKKDRIIIGQNPDGTLRYSQNPLFKFSEDITGLLPAIGPLKYITEGDIGRKLSSKTSPMLRSVIEAASGHDGIDRPLYKATDGGWTIAAKAMNHILAANVPVINGAEYLAGVGPHKHGGLVRDVQDYMAGTGASQIATPLLKALGTATSKGYRGGPDASAAHWQQKAIEDTKSDYMPDIKRKARLGDADGARRDAAALAEQLRRVLSQPQ